MSAVIAGLLAAFQLATGLIAARRLFGRWRARNIDGTVARCSMLGLDWALWSFEAYDRGTIAWLSLLGGLTWEITVPVMLLIAWVTRFLTSAPPRSRAELSAAAAQQAARIAELEQQLGIPRPGAP
jgi:hypothetical protein